MGDTAALISLATSVPPYQFHQKQILAAARDVLTERYPEFEQLSSLFANTGISHRYGVKPIEWYLEQRGWPERTQAFLEGGGWIPDNWSWPWLFLINVIPGVIAAIVTPLLLPLAAALAALQIGLKEAPQRG